MARYQRTKIWHIGNKWNAQKDNNHKGVAVFHDDDIVPEDAIKTEKITTEYKKWLLAKFHHDIPQ